MTLSPWRVVPLPELPKWINLLIAGPTGIVYEQQCGGHRCYQMKQEGYLVPVIWDQPRDGSRYDHGIDPGELTAIFHNGPGDGCPWGVAEIMPAEPVDRLEALVNRMTYMTMDRGWVMVEFDRSRLADTMEAWVPVTTPDGPGVLVWNNCD